MDSGEIGQPPRMDDAGDTSMMDNMDDLFGEAANGLDLGATDIDAGVSIPMPSAPLPASVVLRIGELQRSGCCT